MTQTKTDKLIEGCGCEGDNEYFGETGDICGKDKKYCPYCLGKLQQQKEDFEDEIKFLESYRKNIASFKETFTEKITFNMLEKFQFKLDDRISFLQSEIKKIDEASRQEKA